MSCQNGHTITWRSQPLLNKTPLGNLLISAAALRSGNTFTKMENFTKALSLLMFSQSVYNRIQTYEHYLWSQADTIKNSSSVSSTDSLLSTVELPPPPPPAPNRRNTWRFLKKIWSQNWVTEKDLKIYPTIWIQRAMRFAQIMILCMQRMRDQPRHKYQNRDTIAANLWLIKQIQILVTYLKIQTGSLLQS